MKKNYILCIVLAVILNSCGNEPVYHTKEKPFIIGRIEKVDEDKWRYERQHFDVKLTNFFAIGRQSITTDYELPYSVGDTLRLYCP